MKRAHVTTKSGKVWSSHDQFTLAHESARLSNAQFTAPVFFTAPAEVPETISRKNWIHAPREYHIYSVTTDPAAHQRHREEIKDHNRRERIHAGAAWRNTYRMLTVKTTAENGTPVFCLYIH